MHTQSIEIPVLAYTGGRDCGTGGAGFPGELSNGFPFLTPSSPFYCGWRRDTWVEERVRRHLTYKPFFLHAQAFLSLFPREL